MRKYLQVWKKVLSRKDHINETFPAGISGLGRKSGMSVTIKMRNKNKE